MQLQPIYRALGLLLVLTGVAMVPCALVDIAAREEDWTIFGLTGFVCFCIGGVLAIAATAQGNRKTGTREAFLLTVSVWVVLPLASCLPFLAMGFSFTDAYFETVSGLTTTGSTILTGLDNEQRGLLLWRSILQWIGGVGIIVTALAILPTLRIGGMQLFQTESSDMSGKFLPRVTEIATQITLLYVCLTLLCCFLYIVTGMSVFDAVNHAMTTMAAGGLSTSDLSFAKFYNSRAVEVCIAFMVIAALPFGAMVMMLHGRWTSLIRDPQPRLFLIIVAVACLVLSVFLYLNRNTILIAGDGYVVRNTVFSVLSVITGTGYSITDYGQWGPFSDITFLVLMFVGGCAGSAACGMNVFRVEVMAKTVFAYAGRVLIPNRVTVVRYNRNRVNEEVLQSVMVFIFLYLVIFGFSSVLLSLNGLDAITAYSAAATSISNVGPGLGSEIGPSGTFQGLPDFAKWVLILNMVLGRLEIIPVFVVLSPSFWRK